MTRPCYLTVDREEDRKDLIRALCTPDAKARANPGLWCPPLCHQAPWHTGRWPGDLSPPWPLLAGTGLLFSASAPATAVPGRWLALGMRLLKSHWLGGSLTPFNMPSSLAGARYFKRKRNLGFRGKSSEF